MKKGQTKHNKQEEEMKESWHCHLLQSFQTFIQIDEDFVGYFSANSIITGLNIRGRCVEDVGLLHKMQTLKNKLLFRQLNNLQRKEVMLFWGSSVHS